MENPRQYPVSQEWKEKALEAVDGRLVLVSLSGGKDSTAVALLMKELGIKYKCVHFDTGWEHRDTEDYVRQYLPKHVGPVEIVRNEKYGGMRGLVLKKGMFPSRVRRFCTQELKIFPFMRYLKQYHERLEDPINAIGIRAEESLARSRMPEWEENEKFHCEVWRPLIRWTLEDVVEIHRRHGVEPNPLYLRGAERVGCWPCIFARKAEIRFVAETDPARIDEIEELERQIAEAARERLAKRGETFESLGYTEPTFFMGFRGGKWRKKKMLPIREAVEWARTKRGGMEKDHDDDFVTKMRDSGCLRWGLCDMATEHAETKKRQMELFEGISGEPEGER